MAARKRALHLNDDWRAKIQTSMLINRLSDHVAGKVELTSTQVTAALGLLKKTAPDLSAVEHSGEVEHAYAARVPTGSKNMDEWQSQHANPLNNQTLQ
jgi:hypothetical protein